MYGTLRRGGVRPIPRLFPESEFVGWGAIKGWLYDFGDFPGLVVDPQGGFVRGEVYRVSPEALAQMDAIEEWDPQAPEESLYFRRRRVIELEGGESIEAWVYECNPKRLPCVARIEGGDWIAHVKGKAGG